MAAGAGVVLDFDGDDLVGGDDFEPLVEDLEGAVRVLRVGGGGCGAEAALQGVEAVFEDFVDRGGADFVVVVGFLGRVLADLAGIGLFVADFLGKDFQGLQQRLALKVGLAASVHVGGADAVHAFDLLEPVEGGFVLAGADGDDGFYPGGVEEGIAQVVAVELQEPA
ncbi:hypothetical protein BOFL111202_18780 [Bordetella flabilis]